MIDALMREYEGEYYSQYSLRKHPDGEYANRITRSCFNIYKTQQEAITTSQQKIKELEEYRDVLFDGHAVYLCCAEIIRPIDVSTVLDAVVRLARARISAKKEGEA